MTARLTIGELAKAAGVPTMVGHYDHDCRSGYTPETQERVAERFREDIERFDYRL